MKAAKVLVANRGEIACRVIRSCHRLGLEAVAVYSDADRNAMHVQLADEAVFIGPAPARESYLRAEGLLGAARQSGAQAIHPGYGFLSENADFASAVLKSGLVWVGPSPDCITAMGDKEHARRIAAAAGVPVLSGSERFEIGNLSGLEKSAAQVSYPLLVKASAGGGGIGMRRVDRESDLRTVVQATQSMAEKAFGDGTVYLEHHISPARHVEVQVFGYGDGTGVHLFDRDCSLQRRFQKIVEEAPAPGIPESVRTRLHDTALALVGTQKYEGAGTVEFVYDVEQQRAWFLEMNTRIQVEHPVTEMVTGVDLVGWQLEQAFGTLGKVRQGDIQANGHAVECRLYAERPEKNFLPSPGEIEELTWPSVDDTLRIDTGVRAGDRVTPYYDPLIAKVAAHGDTRAGAVARLLRAFTQLYIGGLRTNVQLLQSILQDVNYTSGRLDTGLALAILSRMS